MQSTTYLTLLRSQSFVPELQCPEGLLWALQVMGRPLSMCAGRHPTDLPPPATRATLQVVVNTMTDGFQSCMRATWKWKQFAAAAECLPG